MIIFKKTYELGQTVPKLYTPLVKVYVGNFPWGLLSFLKKKNYIEFGVRKPTDINYVEYIFKWSRDGRTYTLGKTLRVAYGTKVSLSAIRIDKTKVFIDMALESSPGGRMETILFKGKINMVKVIELNF